MDLEVRVTNRRLSGIPAAVAPGLADEPGTRLFPPEASPEGCASGECLPGQAPAASEGGDGTTRPLKERWRLAVDAVRSVSPRHGKSLAFGRLVAIRPGEIALFFPREAAFHRATVLNLARSTIENALTEHFGRPTRVIEQQDEGAPLSLAEEDARGREDRAKGIETKVRQHPAVQAALRLLGGEIEHIQVLEEERPPEPDLPEER